MVTTCASNSKPYRRSPVRWSKIAKEVGAENAAGAGSESFNDNSSLASIASRA